MATVQVFAAIEAPRERVFALIRDQGQRQRIMPDGWRVLRSLTEQRDAPGAAMEIEWQVGPRPVTQVIQMMALSESQVIEGPPPGENYITTWTVGQDERATLVGLHMSFSYGDFMGEFFVKRRLRRALAQMLARLKNLAEGT